MARTTKNSESKERSNGYKPATYPEARINQIISMAYDEAEKRIREGRATSQELTYFLKQGTPEARLERERLIEENKLLRAKTEQLESQKKTEELFKEAISAFRRYSGEEYESEDDDNDEYY